MENYLILYRKEHIKIYHSALEEYIGEKVNIILFPKNFRSKEPANFYFISTSNIWERLMYFKLAHRHSLGCFYFFQHGHLESKSRKVLFKGKWKNSLKTLLPVALNLRFLRQALFMNQRFQMGYLLHERYRDIVTKVYNLSFVEIQVDNWLLTHEEIRQDKEILFIHENFITAGMSKLSREEELKELDDLFDEFHRIGFHLDICIHPMDRNFKKYKELKGYLQLEERVERIIGNYKVAISVSSSSMFAANKMSVKTLCYNFYGLILPEIKDSLEDRKKLINKVREFLNASL